MDGPRARAIAEAYDGPMTPTGRWPLVLVISLAGCATQAGADDEIGTSDTSDTGMSSSTDASDESSTSSSSGTTTGSSSTDSSSTDTSSTESTTGEPIGSAGCGMAAPASGELVIDIQGMQASYVLSLPPDYDPQTPYPLGFAFHGANRTGPQCQQGDCAGFQAAMENDAVLVYMTSLGGPGWTDDIDLNVAFFEALLDQLVATTCIDESLIFTAGTSSGAHFVNILGCRLGDRLAAISPVAGVLFGTECVGQVAALVIHGVDDGSFAAGMEARDFWRDRNHCTDVTVPPIAEIHDAVVAEPESHGCAEYQGCDAGVPVVWCEHSEGGYDGTTHGWPLFGGDQIWAFVSGL